MAKRTHRTAVDATDDVQVADIRLGSDLAWEHLRASYAANTRWAKADKEERREATRAAREALEDKFLRRADGDPVRAANIRKAYYQNLQLKSLRARREKKAKRIEEARLRIAAEVLGEALSSMKDKGESA